MTLILSIQYGFVKLVGIIRQVHAMVSLVVHVILKIRCWIVMRKRKRAIFMGLSRLAAKCMECPFVDKCDNKRMEALAYCETPNLAYSYAEPIASSMTEPILRETMTVMVDGSPTVVYKDEIEKQLYGSLYSHLGLQYGG